MDNSLKKTHRPFGLREAAALAGLAAVVLFYALRIPHGLGVEDEGWYLTFPHRLLLGDALITDEWHLAQFIGVLLYVPLKLYVLLHGSLEGVILYFRCLYAALQVLLYLFVYSRLRRFGFWAVAAALIFALHVPQFMFLSLGYYSMGLGFACVAGLLMATQKTTNRAMSLLAGLALACAVINNPPLASAYLMYTLCVVLYRYTKTGKRVFGRYAQASFTVRTWKWMTAGVAAAAAAILLIILSRSGFKDLMANLPMLFRDPEYQLVSSQAGPDSIFSVTRFLGQIIGIDIALFIISVVLFALISFDNKRIKHRVYYLMAQLLVFLAYTVKITISIEFPDYACYFFPFALLGLACYILSARKERELFVFIWVLGVVYTVCLDISTEQDFFVSSMGMLLSAVASAVFIGNAFRELREDLGDSRPRMKSAFMKAFAGALVFAALFQIGQEAFVGAQPKFNTEYLTLGTDSTGDTIALIDRDSKDRLDTLITQGPQKGLKTTKARAAVYNGLLDDLNRIKAGKADHVYIAGLHPWMYLALDMPYTTGSTWYLSWSYSAETQRLTDYLKLHPERKPDVIYVPKVQELVYIPLPGRTESLLAELDKTFDYSVSESEFGFILTIA